MTAFKTCMKALRYMLSDMLSNIWFMRSNLFPLNCVGPIENYHPK